MNNFGTLYHYEVKKIISRKLVWIMFLLCIFVIGVVVPGNLLGKYYVDGKEVDTHYHMFQVDRGYQEALSGRAVDQALLEEAMTAYGKIPITAERYTLTQEYQTYARPYSEIFNLVRSWAQLDMEEAMAWEPDEEALYAARRETVEKQWQTLWLSDTEKEFWRKKEAQMNTPVTYYYCDGYNMAINGIVPVGLLVLLFVSVCLSSVFTEEHTRRTDQLILSGAKGKSIIYWAKIAAGVSVSAVCALLMAMSACGFAWGIYGAKGFGASLRISSSMWSYSYPLTVGQACLIAYGSLIVTAVFVSVLVLVLSEVLHNNIATLAVCVGAILAGMMFNIPIQYRAAAQLWNWSPVRFFASWNVFDVWTLPVFGHCFVSWQIVPVFYVVFGIAVAVAGKSAWRNYQVSGR